MRRLLKTGTLGLLVSLVAVLLSVGSASARSAPSGTFTVKPGQTMYFTNMDINSGWYDQAFLVYNNDLEGSVSIGDNSGGNGALPDASWTNSTGSTATVVIGLSDIAGVNCYSNHRCGGGSYDHAALGYVNGKIVVSINDSNGGTTGTTASVPTLGQGNFNATVSIKNH